MDNEISESLDKPQPTKKQSFWELVRFAVIALLVVIPIRLFIAEPFVVSGGSMIPTFQNGNYLIVDKLSYKLGDPKRDDVIVFKYPNDKTKFFIIIKRSIHTHFICFMWNFFFFFFWWKKSLYKSCSSNSICIKTFK